MEELPNLYWQPPQFPDVQTFTDMETLTEVHSGKFEYTINKYVISVVEQLCMYRSNDSNVHAYTGFAFPKLPTLGFDKKGNQVINDNRQCVVKVKVTWRNLRFDYELTCLEKEAVPRVVPDAVESAPSVLKASSGSTEFVVALSREDLGLFGVEAT